LRSPRGTETLSERALGLDAEWESKEETVDDVENSPDDDQTKQAAILSSDEASDLVPTIEHDEVTSPTPEDVEGKGDYVHATSATVEEQTVSRLQPPEEAVEELISTEGVNGTARKGNAASPAEPTAINEANANTNDIRCQKSGTPQLLLASMISAMNLTSATTTACQISR
jgi:hypothetical protein